MGRVLFEELGGLAVKLVLAVICGIVAYHFVASAFAAAAHQAVAP